MHNDFIALIVMSQHNDMIAKTFLGRHDSFKELLGWTVLIIGDG